MNKPDDIRNELVEKKHEAQPSEKRLAFDFKTGELVLKQPDEPQRGDEVVVDQIYRDGFFAEEVTCG